eukprot:834516_1
MLLSKDPFCIDNDEDRLVIWKAIRHIAQQGNTHTPDASNVFRAFTIVQSKLNKDNDDAKEKALDVGAFKDKDPKEWSEDEVVTWLCSLQGGRYKLHADTFILNEIDGEKFQYLSDDFLKEIGIMRIGHRHGILKAVYQLLHEYDALDIASQPPHPSLPKDYLDAFAVGQEEYDQCIEMLQREMPCFFDTKPVNTDRNLIRCIAVGNKLHFPYLQYLIDAYVSDSTYKIDHSIEKHAINWLAWAETHPYFKKLEDIMVDGKESAKAVTIASMGAFFNRIFPRIQIPPSLKIVDSLKEIMVQVVDVCEFISDLNVAPWQIDVCFVVASVSSHGEAKEVDESDDDDDDDLADDLSDDDESVFEFGNIEGSLKDAYGVSKLILDSKAGSLRRGLEDK